MWKKLKELDQTLSLPKRYPNYFNKSIFRAGFIIVCLLFFFVVYKENLITINNKIYLSCDSDNQCLNPFYKCDKIFDSSFECLDYFDERCDPMGNYQSFSNFCHKIEKFGCDKVFCDRQYLEPGEVIGETPGWLFANFGLIGLMIFAFSVGCNHVYYKIKK